MSTYNLYRWSIISNASPYTAPEAIVFRLQGFRDNETKEVVTSPVVKAEGKYITTKSGSTYILQDINIDYLNYLLEIGQEIDLNNPIRTK